MRMPATSGKSRPGQAPQFHVQSWKERPHRGGFSRAGNGDKHDSSSAIEGLWSARGGAIGRLAYRHARASNSKNASAGPRGKPSTCCSSEAKCCGRRSAASPDITMFGGLIIALPLMRVCAAVQCGVRSMSALSDSCAHRAARARTPQARQRSALKGHPFVQRIHRVLLCR